MNMLADPREHLVVIGNGMAGMRTVEELLKHKNGRRYRITVFGAEPHVNYNRIMLSSVLSGDKSVDEIIINSREWYDGNSIRLFAGDAVTAIDREAKTVTAASGLSVPYDRLLIATGSRPLAPPIPGLGLPGVCAFRDIADVDKMLAAARTHKRAAVIGGGLGPQTTRHVGGACPSDADADGAPARRPSWPAFAARSRPARHRVLYRWPDGGDPWHGTG
jgi:nitrite reductase (NADH) large subunit